MSGDPPRGPWSDAHGFLQFNPQGKELARYPAGYVEGLQAEIERLRALVEEREQEARKLRVALEEPRMIVARRGATVLPFGSRRADDYEGSTSRGG